MTTLFEHYTARWPHPDGSTITLRIDHTHAVVTVDDISDVPYAEAWIADRRALHAATNRRHPTRFAAWHVEVA